MHGGDKNRMAFGGEMSVDISERFPFDAPDAHPAAEQAVMEDDGGHEEFRHGGPSTKAQGRHGGT